MMKLFGFHASQFLNENIKVGNFLKVNNLLLNDFENDLLTLPIYTNEQLKLNNKYILLLL